MKRRGFLQNTVKFGALSFLPVSWVDLSENVYAEQANDINRFAFLCEPYLQNSSFDGITVMWITSQNSVSWVELVEPDGAVRKISNAAHGLINANVKIAKIRIDNLKAGTGYQFHVFSKEIKVFDPYKIEYGETIQKGPFKFTTPSGLDNEVSFVVLNDTHDSPGNIIDPLSKIDSLGNYDFVVMNGDTFNWYDDEAQILKNLLTPIGTVLSTRLPFLMVRGNHETRGKYARESFNYFDSPENKSYFAFTRGPVRFIVMDSGEDKEDSHEEYSGLVAFDDFRKEEAEWLAKEIKSKEFKKAKFRVVIMHIPPYHSKDWHGNIQCRELFNPLFNKGKIDLLISGHTHRYGFYKPDPATHNYPIVIGGGNSTGKDRGGQRTVIKVIANNKSLSINMLVDDGAVVASYKIDK